MKFCRIILYSLLNLLSAHVYAQQMEAYTGDWEGKIEEAQAFNFEVVIEHTAADKAIIRIKNNSPVISRDFSFPTGEEFTVEISKGLSFQGLFNADSSEINGFIKSGLLLYQLNLKKSAADRYAGRWDVLMVDSLQSPNLYLSVENGEGDDFQAYPVFGDNRFTGTWCANFQKEQDTIFFTDFKTGLRFKGLLEPSKIILNVCLGDGIISRVEMTKSQEDWQIGGLSSGAENRLTKPLALADGWETLSLASASVERDFLRRMVAGIQADSLPNTHSILIAKEGKLVLEEYFEGYKRAIPHDMRSASKSISSAMVGITLDKNIIQRVDQSIYEFLPPAYRYTADSLKARISIHSLLTMSSGLDAIDFGINRTSVASEDNYQPTQDWVKTIMEAPMINQPSTQANYGTANPYLLGVVLSEALGQAQALELFMDQHLFQPMGITNYIIQTDMEGRPYFGGGMYLRPRDMLKFGQLYLNQGVWKGRRILPKAWVEKSFREYLPLENTQDRNGYGYLWWHHTYELNGQQVKSIEARGAGGQYIFVIPDLDAVVVITSGNYRNGKTQQPEQILENYILPALLEGEKAALSE